MVRGVVDRWEGTRYFPHTDANISRPRPHLRFGGGARFGTGRRTGGRALAGRRRRRGKEEMLGAEEANLPAFPARRRRRAVRTRNILTRGRRERRAGGGKKKKKKGDPIPAQIGEKKRAKRAAELRRVAAGWLAG